MVIYANPGDSKDMKLRTIIFEVCLLLNRVNTRNTRISAPPLGQFTPKCKLNNSCQGLD